MIIRLKQILYFPVASYFRFFAAIRLKMWKPRIVVVTGSNGKTTLLHLLESQIGEKAKYSHHANSSFGIPFDILGLKRTTLFKSEWFKLFFIAPFKTFSKLPKESLYIVEADCDRPGEGKFLAEFLKPEVVLWISISKTHSMTFDRLVISSNQRESRDLLHKSNIVKKDSSTSLGMTFKTVEQAIAYEFGFFLEYCSRLALLNADEPLQLKQKNRTKAEIKLIEKKDNLKKYVIKKDGTEFIIKDQKYTFPFLLPKEVFYAIEMCEVTIKYLNLTFNPSFKNFTMPPGRGSIFAGIKNTTIIDSCYNANFSSMKAILDMYKNFPSKYKWAVLGDMLEQGKSEKEEHEKLADLILNYNFDKVILMGPRVYKYAYPKLLSLRATAKQSHGDGHSRFNRDRDDGLVVEKFLGPKEVLDYLLVNINGGETILFKGARFMEGIIEHLLKDKNDIAKLARREKVWEMRRKKWGL